MSEERIISAPAFSGWAIIELMGHRIRCGMIQEVEIAGGKMLRVDIPINGNASVTEFYSTSALYAIRPCSEEIARQHVANNTDPRPVRPVDYRERKMISNDMDDEISFDAEP